MGNIVLELNKKSESFYHKAIKQLIYKFVSEANKNIVESCTEKYLKNRRADVFFKFKNGYEVVVEIQHSKISVNEISERTKEYNQKGIHVLWILHGKGKCVASPKFPEHKKNVKISSTEKFLHTMYGGRVYYVNVNNKENNFTVTYPFALHFSFSDKKSKKSFRKNFEYYYIRNSNCTPIPNWNILCTNFKGIKIARFYDKNIKALLEYKILNFVEDFTKRDPQDCRKYRKGKNLIKLIINRFKNYYGKPLIIDCISLIKDKIEINEKSIIKFKKKY